jgi:hypothetical protein
MKTKQPPKAKKDELDRKEWYFPDLPKAEREAAFIYEYARELEARSPATLDLIIRSEGASHLIRMRPRGRVDFGKIMRDHVPDFVRISKDRFPGIPWQGLDHEMRTMLVEAAKKLFPADAYLADIHLLHDATSRAYALRPTVINLKTPLWTNQPFVENEYFRQTPSGLQINFDQSDSGIMTAIAQWLPMERKRLGMPDVKYKPQTGRGSSYDRLNALGALRLVGRYPTDKELANYTKRDHLGYRAFYNTVRELREAAKKAEELLNMLS